MQFYGLCIFLIIIIHSKFPIALHILLSIKRVHFFGIENVYLFY